MLDTILSIGMVIIFGIVFNVLIPALIISFASALLRKTSGGAHATTSFRCAAIGAFVAVGFAVLIEAFSKLFSLYNTAAYFISAFVVSYLIIIKLAPVDSPNKRIVKESKIQELKKKSVRTLSIYGIICSLLIIAGGFYGSGLFLKYSVLVSTGFLWQSFTLTSIGHVVSNALELPFGYIKLTGGEKE